VAEGDDQPTKTCPDCAERVLVAARRCRHCGYRFDRPEPEPGDEGLLSLIVRPKPRPTTIAAIVSRWGFELDDGEKAIELAIGKVDGVAGFVLVTDTRLGLFTGRGRAVSVTADPPLNLIDDVEVIRRGFSRRLHVTWGREAATIDNLSRAKFSRLRSLLEDALKAR
jgi:ribosomal protein L40E